MRTMLMRRLDVVAVLGALLLVQACGLDKQSIPDLVGPAGQGQDLRLAANPDYVVADNTSQSTITATLRGANGQALSGRAIVFEITDPAGTPAGIGELSTASGLRIASGASATAVTNSSGVAQVIFSAPARSDITAPTNIVVRGRQVADDYNGVVWRTVSLQVIPAEPRLFPPNPTNSPPTCGIVVQPLKLSYAVDEQILFQTAASDSGRIVRYEWDFGDATFDDKPDVNHAYRKVGTFTVRHVVTDNNGSQATCTAVIIVK